MSVQITEGGVEILHLLVEDAVVRDLLGSQPADRRDEITARAVAVGARGVLTMGLGLDLTELGTAVGDTVEAALERARGEVADMLASARKALSDELDPQRSSSVTYRMLGELGLWRKELLAGLDPANRQSHTSRLLDEIETLVGRGGALEGWLSAALDPQSDQTAIGRLARTMQERLDRLHEIVVEERGRKNEAARGTHKGFAFEDEVEAQVRQAARALGAVVERTSRSNGELGMVGDLTVCLPTGASVVVEVKDQARVPLTGRESILDELDRAMTNRGAGFALCVSAQDAYPAEVGSFGVYGNKVLVTGDGTMVEVGLRWAAAVLAADSSRSDRPTDPAAISAKLVEIRSLAQLFSSNRRALTEVGRSIEAVRASLSDMRARLIGLTEELLGDLGGSGPEVVELRR